MKDCEACGGSGICPECKGEGFILRKLSDENAERARLASKNAATRYTAGYVHSFEFLSSFLLHSLSAFIVLKWCQASKEMELLHKVLFCPIVQYVQWPWKDSFALTILFK